MNPSQLSLLLRLSCRNRCLDLLTSSCTTTSAESTISSAEIRESKICKRWGWTTFGLCNWPKSTETRFWINVSDNFDNYLILFTLWPWLTSSSTFPPTPLMAGVYLIRKYHFLEMVNKSPLEATAFLQTKVSAVVNHESEEERQQFHLLASRSSLLVTRCIHAFA